MLNPIKLFKSKPYIDGLEKDVTTMNKSNWRTNAIGIITLLLGLAGLWAPANMQSKVQATTALFAGAGLVAAKDGNK